MTAKPKKTSKKTGKRPRVKKQEPASLESIYGKRERPLPAESRPDVKALGKKKTMHAIYLVGTAGDLARLGKKLEIYGSRYTGPVRKVEILPSSRTVVMKAGDDSWTVDLPFSEKVYYEEWFDDKGSYVVWDKMLGDFGKIATEYDRVRVVSRG